MQTSPRRGLPEPKPCQTGRPIEQFRNMVAGHAGRTKPLDQFRWDGQRVGPDVDHGPLDLPGGEPPALRAIRSGIGDECSGDVASGAAAAGDQLAQARSRLSMSPVVRLNRPPAVGSIFEQTAEPEDFPSGAAAPTGAKHDSGKCRARRPVRNRLAAGGRWIRTFG
jgi:hypothetical protein